MFVVEIGSVLVTVLFFVHLDSSSTQQNLFAGLVAAWLWFTVVFANFAEAIAEGRGKAQAESCGRRGPRPSLTGVVQTARSKTSRARNFASATRSSSRQARSFRATATVIEGIASVDEVGDHGRVGSRHPRSRG